MSHTARYAACCDIGGTKALLGMVDRHGHVLVRERYLLGAPLEPEHLVSDLCARLRSLAASADLPWDAVGGIGCSAAVMADVDRGLILSAPNLIGAHRDVPFVQMMEESIGRPTLIEMDAYAAALGEAWKGVGTGVDYFVYVVVGTGVGAGILMEGRVFRGWRGTAGEFGHTTIDPNGPWCNCGRYGCLEALVSGPAIALRARGAVLQGRQTRMADLADSSQIDASAVFEAARAGDAVAREVVQTTVEYLAIGLSNLIHLLNPRVIALGGGVATGGVDLLLDPLRRELFRRCGSWVDPQGTHIVLAKLGEDAALLGAARLVWNRVMS
jgi:glucokinase